MAPKPEAEVIADPSLDFIQPRAARIRPRLIYILQINTIVLHRPRLNATLPPPGIAGTHRLFENLNQNKNRLNLNRRRVAVSVK